jgi:hypothetical protein
LHALLLGLLLLPVSLATAEAPSDKLETLMKASGLSEQLVQFEQLMLVQLRQGVGEPSFSGPVSDRVEEAVSSAYAADRLQQRVLRHLEGGLSVDEIDRVLEWLGSPLGERITRLEEVASTPEAYREQNEIGDFLVENVGEERLERYERLEEAVEVSELTYSISVNTMLAVAQGVALVAPGVESPPVDELRESIESRKEEMIEGFRQASIRSFAYTYRELEVADLDRYIEFAESQIGRKYHSVVSAAYERALSEAGRDFGLALGSSATS